MKPGDIVKLKSGGPPMVIAEVIKGQSHPDAGIPIVNMWACHWFNEGELRSGMFYEIELTARTAEDNRLIDEARQCR